MTRLANGVLLVSAKTERGVYDALTQLIGMIRAIGKTMADRGIRSDLARQLCQVRRLRAKFRR